ncbi:MAG: hypothetical protein AB1608_02285 [Thermoproteota archaeon]
MLSVGKKTVFAITIPLAVILIVGIGIASLPSSPQERPRENNNKFSEVTPTSSQPELSGSEFTTGPTVPTAELLQSARSQIANICGVGNMINSIPDTDIESIVGSALTGDMQGKILNAHCDQVRSTLIDLETKMLEHSASTYQASSDDWYHTRVVGIEGDFEPLQYSQMSDILKKRLSYRNDLKYVSGFLNTNDPNEVLKDCRVFIEWEKQRNVRTCYDATIYQTQEEKYNISGTIKYVQVPVGTVIVAGAGLYPSWVLVEVTATDDIDSVFLPLGIFQEAIKAYVCDCWQQEEPGGYYDLGTFMVEMYNYHTSNNNFISQSPVLELNSRRIQIQVMSEEAENTYHVGNKFFGKTTWNLILSY